MSTYYGPEHSIVILKECPTSQPDIRFSNFVSYQQTHTELTTNPVIDKLKNVWLVIEGVYFECKFDRQSLLGSYANYSRRFFVITQMYVPDINVDQVDWHKVMNTLIVVIRRGINTDVSNATIDALDDFFRVLDTQNSVELYKDQETLQKIRSKLKQAYDQIKETKEFKVLTENTYAAIYAAEAAAKAVVRGAKSVANMLDIKP